MSYIRSTEDDIVYNYHITDYSPAYLNGYKNLNAIDTPVNLFTYTTNLSLDSPLYNDFGIVLSEQYAIKEINSISTGFKINKII